jgi:hypothetical protein
MKNVFFGLGLPYGFGVRPSIAMSDDGRIIEVHQRAVEGSEVHDEADLAYRVGVRQQMLVDWAEEEIYYGKGYTPSIAFDGHFVVEVHRAEQGDTLSWRLGSWNDGDDVSDDDDDRKGKEIAESEDEGDDDNVRVRIDLSQPTKFAHGKYPNVALSGRNVVAVHESSSIPVIWYNLGRIEDDSILWLGNNALGEGIRPSVAINGHGEVVIVYGSPSNSNLYYRLGLIGDADIFWGQAIALGAGADASVAFTDDGHVIVVHQASQSKELMQRFGKIRDKSIDWAGDAVHFDEGLHPCVACANGMAVQAHESEYTMKLWASSSRITNRARWMQHHMRYLADKTLSQLTTGASHDAGMYVRGALATFGKTQNLNLYRQLSNGIRYFDLRPKWAGGTLYVHHGGVSGPALSEIIDDVQRFMREGHRELIVLKFSHYDKFDDDAYVTLVMLLQEKLGDWLYRTPLVNRRLADIPLREFLRDSGVILAVCDEDYPVAIPAAGIWVYRDYNSASVQLGDLRVYDKYSASMDYQVMRDGQLEQFRRYDGRCASPNTGLPCDQFLLSWTLTPPTGVWHVSKKANRHLGAVMAEIPTQNLHGRSINYLYVDYVEYSRATDVAMFMNGIE